MDSFLVKGGSPLHGNVPVKGSKNSSLPIIFAALLGDTPSTIDGVPSLRDIWTTATLMAEMGVHCSHKNSLFTVDPRTLSSNIATYDLVRTMRASVLALGPLLARNGKASIYMPGGCAIGARPIDMHIDGLKAMGTSIEVVEGYIKATASRLTGCDYTFRKTTVTGTANLLMAACLAKGTTVLRNAAIEPEIADLCSFLTAMGADISWPEERAVRIEGKTSLSGTEHQVIPDRIEAGTFMAAAVATQGRIRLQGMQPESCQAVIECIRKTGATVEFGEGSECEVDASMNGRPQPVEITTAPYPGFPTDMQAQLMAVACLARGKSQITETIFEGRFMHAAELQRMGANIGLKGNTAVIEGKSHLEGAHVMATDLRASASLVIAGLAAQGETQIDRVYHLDRGYEALETRFQALGGNVTRQSP